MLKEFTFLARIMQHHLTGKRFPLFVNFAVTNVCNLDCIYCCGAYHDRQKRDFTTQQVFDILDNLAKMGTRMININGGEPLIRKDIGEIIERAKSRKMICGMNCNGIFIKNKINEIQALDSICVSIDGSKTQNDLNRGKGSYEKIMEGILCALEHKMHVHTNTVITKNNVHAIEFMLEFARKYNVRAQFHFPFEESAYSRKKGSNVKSVSDEEIKNLLGKIIKYKKEGLPVQFSIDSHRYTQNWPFSYQKRLLYEGDAVPEEFKVLPCYAGKLMCFIDADGFVYPCSQLNGNFPALNLLEVGFVQAWEKLTNNKCRSCYFICHIEFNQIFNLNPKAILNSMRQ